MLKGEIYVWRWERVLKLEFINFKDFSDFEVKKDDCGSLLNICGCNERRS